MFFKTSVAVAATAIGLGTLSLAAQAATVRVPLTYTYSSGLSSGSAGTGYFDIDDSLLGPNTSILFPGNVNDLQGFSLTFTGLASSPSTTTFALANLTNWLFKTNGTGTIIDANFDSSLNADGYDLAPAEVLFGLLIDPQGGESYYQITLGTPGPVPVQSTPEPGGVVALLGLGLGALASRGKKRG
ncbi:MAG: hypothetical protein O9324_03920 [Microcystis sp. LE19-84.1B]|uniref:hypothetical protein n=1 Tax=Microcystis sp. LE19-84.1B TaxID=3016438 RepID=UPI0022BB69BB|nr:hypothetical protein [Microcystis sp. LE19-84.1B]MCZ8223117.1 hypothetical protein [Microcystis sp. LE19-84.1B]